MIDFVFRGDALALDFVNTEVIARGKRRDLLQNHQDFELWWKKAKYFHPELGELNPDGVELDRVKEFRAVLRRIFTGVSAGQKPLDDDLATLNNILQSGYLSIEPNEDTSYSIVYKTDSNSR